MDLNENTAETGRVEAVLDEVLAEGVRQSAALDFLRTLKVFERWDVESIDGWIDDVEAGRTPEFPEFEILGTLDLYERNVE